MRARLRAFKEELQRRMHEHAEHPRTVEANKLCLDICIEPKIHDHESPWLRARREVAGFDSSPRKALLPCSSPLCRIRPCLTSGRTLITPAGRKLIGMKIAVLGLGIIGSAWAKNLIADGHAVRCWNRTPRDFSDRALRYGSGRRLFV